MSEAFDIQAAMESLWRQCIDSPERPDTVLVHPSFLRGGFRRKSTGKQFARLMGARGRKKAIAASRHVKRYPGLLDFVSNTYWRG